jgi:hypothetical protein
VFVITKRASLLHRSKNTCSPKKFYDIFFSLFPVLLLSLLSMECWIGMLKTSYGNLTIINTTRVPQLKVIIKLNFSERVPSQYYKWVVSWDVFRIPSIGIIKISYENLTIINTTGVPHLKVISMLNFSDKVPSLYLLKSFPSDVLRVPSIGSIKISYENLTIINMIGVSYLKVISMLNFSDKVPS